MPLQSVVSDDLLSGRLLERDEIAVWVRHRKFENAPRLGRETAVRMNDALLGVGFEQLLYSVHGDSAGRLGGNARVMAVPEVDLNAVTLNDAVIWMSQTQATGT